eukprot:511976_1
MQNISRINNRSQMEFRIQTIVDNHTIGLRRKYFDKLTKIYLYDVSKCDVMTVQSTINELLTDPTNDVLHLPISLQFSLNGLSDVRFLAIKQSNHYMSTGLSTYLYGVFLHFTAIKKPGLSPAQLLRVMNTLHLRVDINAFNEAMELLLEYGNISDIDNWSREVKQMYEINYNEYYRIIGDNVTETEYIEVR